MEFCQLLLPVNLENLGGNAHFIIMSKGDYTILIRNDLI